MYLGINRWFYEKYLVLFKGYFNGRYALISPEGAILLKADHFKDQMYVGDLVLQHVELERKILIEKLKNKKFGNVK